MGGRGRSARSLRRKRTRAGRKGTAADDSDAQSQSESESEEEEEEDDDDRPMKWVKVGRVLAGQSLRAPPLDFMQVLSLFFLSLRSIPPATRLTFSLSAARRYGPLAIEVKEKKARTQRAKNQWEAEQVRPEEVSFCCILGWP